MVLSKESRTAIYEANGLPVQIPWPLDIDPPKRGHVYTIQSRARTAGASTILVLDWREFGDEEDGEGLLVRVQQQADPARSRVSKARRRHVGGVGTLVTHDPRGADSTYTETEAERIHPLDEDYMALQANHRTAVLTAEHRCQAKVAKHEREVREAKAAGVAPALAEGRLERARSRLDEARRHEAAHDHRQPGEPAEAVTDQVVLDVVAILDEARGLRL